MGSRTFDGVWFAVYSQDHLPAHVHGRYGGARVIVDLLPGGAVAQSPRRDAVTPANAKKGDIRHILETAATHYAELIALWEKTHGNAA